MLKKINSFPYLFKQTFINSKTKIEAVIPVFLFLQSPVQLLTTVLFLGDACWEGFQYDNMWTQMA